MLLTVFVHSSGCGVVPVLLKKLFCNRILSQNYRFEGAICQKREEL
jgi:hypothetical protein